MQPREIIENLLKGIEFDSLDEVENEMFLGTTSEDPQIAYVGDIIVIEDGKEYVFVKYNEETGETHEVKLSDIQ